jgi:hypothetical protein
MTDAGSISERRQRVLAKMLLDPSFEQRLRREPALVADQECVDEAFVRQLATISVERVRQFRASQRHKEEVRAGKAPKRLP